jgi:hypothetical protein
MLNFVTFYEFLMHTGVHHTLRMLGKLDKLCFLCVLEQATLMHAQEVRQAMLMHDQTSYAYAHLES